MPDMWRPDDKIRVSYTRKTSNLSGRKNIYRMPNGKYRGLIRIKGKLYHIGYYKTEIDAQAGVNSFLRSKFHRKED